MAAYVVVQGGTGDGNEERPAGDLERVIDAANPGDEVIVRGPLHQAVTVRAQFPVGEMVTVRPHDVDGGVIDGRYSLPVISDPRWTNPITGVKTGWAALVRLAGAGLRWQTHILHSAGRGLVVGGFDGALASDIEVSRCEIGHCRVNTILVDGAQHLVFYWVRGHHGGDYYPSFLAPDGAMRDPGAIPWPVCNSFLRCNDVVVNECEFDHNYGEGVGVNRWSRGVKVQRCRIWDNSRMQVLVQGAHDASVICNELWHTGDEAFLNGRARGPCVVVNNEANLGEFSVDRLLIAENLMHHGRYGVGFWGSEGTGAAIANAQVHFNTMADMWESSIHVKPRAALRNVEIAANLLMQPPDSQYVGDQLRWSGNGWGLASQGVPGYARSAGDLYDVTVTNDYRPERRYPAQAVWGSRQTMGAHEWIDRAAPLPEEPPVEPPVEDALTLRVRGPLATQLRALLSNIEIVL